jgi:hypothetical protein
MKFLIWSFEEDRAVITTCLIVGVAVISRAAFRYGYYRGRLDEFLGRPER